MTESQHIPPQNLPNPMDNTKSPQTATGLSPKNLELALEQAIKAHHQTPQAIEPLHEICILLTQLQRDEECLPWANQALLLAPADYRFVVFKAFALEMLGENFDAVATWKKYQTLTWSTGFYELHLARNLMLSGELDSALNILANTQKKLKQTQDRAAQNLLPFVEATLGEAQLRANDALGFMLQHTRRLTDCPIYHISQVPQYDPTRPLPDLKGKKLLISHQGGYGDQILFYSWVQNWLDLGTEIMLMCDSNLLTLLKATYPQCRVIATPRAGRAYTPLPPSAMARVQAFNPHLHLSLFQLPLLVASQKNIPSPFFKPYLRLPVEAQVRMRDWVTHLRQTHAGKQLIGIFWDCGQRHFAPLGAQVRNNADRRSIPVSDMNRVFMHPEVSASIHFVNLHSAQNIKLAGTPAGNVSHFPEGFVDLATNAACIELLDAVISTDSIIANLSVMQGKPTCVLNNYASDWRWGGIQHQGASPWFEKTSILSQKISGDWNNVIDELIALLLTPYDNKNATSVTAQ